MKLNHNLVIGFVTSGILVTFCLYVYSTNSGQQLIMSSNCRELSSLHDKAILNLRNILSTMEQNPKQYNQELTLKLADALRLLTSDVTEDPNTSTVTDSSGHSKKVNLTDRFACPEKFLHAKYGDPYFVTGSWIVEDCGKVQPIPKSLTVVFVSSDEEVCSKENKEMLLRIDKLYPEIPIVIGAAKKSKCSFDKPNLKIVQFSSKTKLGSKLNELISSVKTPLTLIARNLDDFNWLARIERQLSVLSLEKDVVIVGGSVRNSSGHWRAGCYQTELKYYILRYSEGYYKSKHECMYCDHLIGPFVARTKFLSGNKFDKDLEDDVVFDDFFLTLKQSESNGFILTCPDVMYHSTDPGFQLKINKRETWLPLTRKWKLNRIVIPEGPTYKFTCSESSVNCKSLAGQVGALMMPVCCRDAMINGYKTFHEFALKHNIVYQIEGGSCLGAIKLCDVIPWDFDGDGSYYKDKMNLFTKKIDWTNSEGAVVVDHIDYKAKGFFYVSVPDAFIEYWAKTTLWADAANLTETFTKKPTLVRIGDGWVYAPASPGLYSRNYYGNEILRHSNSYYHLGRGHWYSPYNVNDPFIRCKKKNHACLDQFVNDGSFQFKIP